MACAHRIDDTFVEFPANDTTRPRTDSLEGQGKPPRIQSETFCAFRYAERACPDELRVGAHWYEEETVTKIDLTRREALGLLGLGCSCSAFITAVPSPLGNGIAADFSGPAGSGITINYWDIENFQVVPLVAGAETWVVSGKICLVVRPSIVTAGVERVLWVGELRGAPPPWPRAELPSGLTSPSPPDTRFSALGEPVYDVPLATEEPTRSTITLNVAKLPRLACAQYIVYYRMRTSMDMSLCGVGVDRITSTWRPEFTGAGFAIVGDEGGSRLAAPPRDLRAGRPVLPTGVAIEDYRLPSSF